MRNFIENLEIFLEDLGTSIDEVLTCLGIFGFFFLAYGFVGLVEFFVK